MGGHYKVVFGPRSHSDLKDLVCYIRTASGAPVVAERFGAALIQKALSLATLPERGRIVPELGLSDVREIIFRNYRIVYRMTPEQVQVLRFGMRLAALRRLVLRSFLGRNVWRR